VVWSAFYSQFSMSLQFMTSKCASHIA